MDFLSALIHLGNFMAPALVIPLLLWLPVRLIFGASAKSAGFWRLWLVPFALCLAVLVAGLVVFGRDGKIMTYAALVLVCATLQWLLLRGWRR